MIHFFFDRRRTRIRNGNSRIVVSWNMMVFVVLVTLLTFPRNSGARRDRKSTPGDQVTSGAVTCRQCIEQPQDEQGRRKVLCQPARTPNGGPNGSPHGNNIGDPCYEVCRYAAGGETSADDSGSMLEPEPVNKVNKVGGSGEGHIPNYEEVMVQCVQCQQNRIPFCAYAEDCPHTAIFDCTNDIDGEGTSEALRFKRKLPSRLRTLSSDRLQHSSRDRTLQHTNLKRY